MKNLILLSILFIICTSCGKQTIIPNEENKQIAPTEVGVYISFQDVFNSGVEKIYIFENDQLINSINVGCEEKFLAELNKTYCFKKLKKDSLIPLFGTETTINTYFTFLTNHIKEPTLCIDYVTEGLSINPFVTTSERCIGSHYTFNTWF